MRRVARLSCPIPSYVMMRMLVLLSACAFMTACTAGENHWAGSRVSQWEEAHANVPFKSGNVYQYIGP